MVTLPFIFTGHTAEYASEKGAGKAIFGINTFDIPLPTWQDLYREQLQAPMFVFQAFCMLLYCLDEYWCVFLRTRKRTDCTRTPRKNLRFFLAFANDHVRIQGRHDCPPVSWKRINTHAVHVCSNLSPQSLMLLWYVEPAMLGTFRSSRLS